MRNKKRRHISNNLIETAISLTLCMIIRSFDDFLYHTHSLFKGTLRGKIIIVKNKNFKHSFF